MQELDDLAAQWETALREADEKDPKVTGIIKRQGRGTKTVRDAPAPSTTKPKGPEPGAGTLGGPVTPLKVYTKEDVKPHVAGVMQLATELANVTPYTDQQIDLTAACTAPVATKYQDMFIDQYPELALLLCVGIMGGIKYMELREAQAKPTDPKPAERVKDI